MKLFTSIKVSFSCLTQQFYATTGHDIDLVTCVP